MRNFAAAPGSALRVIFITNSSTTWDLECKSYPVVPDSLCPKIPACDPWNTRRCVNAGLMLGQRLRHWPSLKSALGSASCWPGCRDVDLCAECRGVAGEICPQSAQLPGTDPRPGGELKTAGQRRASATRCGANVQPASAARRAHFL